MALYKNYKYKDIKIEVDLRIEQIEDLHVRRVFEKFFEIIPEKIYDDFLTAIKVGQFFELDSQKKTAGYANGTIYVSKFLYKTPRSANAELLKNLVHESGHIFEKSFYDLLYLNGAVEEEFREKKQKIADAIPEFDPVWVFSHKYDANLESFIDWYDESEFRITTGKILPNPYAVLSMSEYIAYNFEEYFLRNKNTVKAMSPVIYSILSGVEDGKY